MSDTNEVKTPIPPPKEGDAVTALQLHLHKIAQSFAEVLDANQAGTEQRGVGKEVFKEAEKLVDAIGLGRSKEEQLQQLRELAKQNEEARADMELALKEAKDVLDRVKRIKVDAATRALEAFSRARDDVMDVERSGGTSS